MAEPRHRKFGDPTKKDSAAVQGESDESDNDDIHNFSAGDGQTLHPAAPTGTDSAPEILESVTKNMSQRWKSYTVRFVLSILMIVGFFLILYMGPLALVLLVMGIQMKCFSEIINIGYVVYRSQNLPWFRSLSWYFLVTANYYVNGEMIIDQFGVLLQKTDFMINFVVYHKFISISLYVAGIVAFVVSLKKKYYLRQFTLFGYTHVTLLVVAVGANFLTRLIFEGIFWFFLCTSMIICNDIWAYLFGFFFGKTPLIKLSPKKTLEGYLGGGLATIVYSIIVTYVMLHYDYLVCPIEYAMRKGSISLDSCIRNPVFMQAEYSMPATLQSLLSLVGQPSATLHIYPIMFHVIFLATFASLIGPFGGFFASGFKRAFRIKDFGDIFPGHGGFMDRFDCQILMGAFMYTYVTTFIRIPNPHKVLATIFAMPSDDQLTILHQLCDSLGNKGLVDCSNILVS
ncbi:phosphatidate cytidylyltransferase, photoreceptor-specific-like [Watersipora subatra]|uniref:phosphatidate cytidylyltransferase, photoreceptor-specific-like n=1 Tax=Watersipora subatra TaxID=2589382 RepID=UPI00355AEB36